MTEILWLAFYVLSGLWLLLVGVVWIFGEEQA